MKYGILRYSYSNNIGDEIQSIAAQRFLPQTDLSVERDRLHWYREKGSVTVPFNGWFTRPPFPDCWPPPTNIIPLFVSWYAVTPEDLINQSTKEYFRQFAPIGCRSIPTIAHFEKLGIAAYHSGCLTLTLQPSTLERNDDIYIVDADPALLRRVIPESIIRQAKFISHLTPTGQFSSKTGFSATEFLMKGLNRIDRNQKYFSQSRERWLHLRHLKRMAEAQARLDLYSRAKLVITSLLHCSMPCLALGTPVILLKPDLSTNPRFKGLAELTRYRSDGEKISIDWEHPEPNGDSHRKIADNLISTITSLISRASL